MASEQDIVIPVSLDEKTFKRFARFDTLRLRKKWVRPAVFAGILTYLSFIDVDEDGKFIITATEQNTIDAMNYACDIITKYQMPQPEGSEWNWFFPAFKSGMAAFHVGQCYEANPGSDLYGMEDEFGIVPFPKGTSEDAKYCHVQSENTCVIPGNIDRETANKMAIIYDMWREDTPGYEDDEEGWKTDLYDRFYDDESIDITYALLRDNPKADTSIMLGSNNDVLGNGFFWNPSCPPGSL